MESQPSKLQPESQRHGLLASRKQNTAFDAQGRRAWFYENRWGIVAAFFILSFMPAGIAYMTLSGARRIAVLKTPAKQGRAYVFTKTYTPAQKGRGASYTVTFRFNGRLIDAYPSSVVQWDKTPTDAFMPVTYHIGENGLVLITDWQTPPAK